MIIDHGIFFASYRAKFGPLTVQSKVDGIEGLLTFWEADEAIDDIRWAAYMFATVKHECGDRWQPIEEFGKGSGHPYGNPVNVEGSDGVTYSCTYYGRGYVQLTWQQNYKKMSTALGMKDTLVIHPEQALEPETAYKIMSYGMRTGAFTGKTLANYIHDDHCDYQNARRIINGLDKADLIMGYAQDLEACFKDSTTVQTRAPLASITSAVAPDPPLNSD